MDKRNRSVKKVYFTKFGEDEPEVALVADRPKEEWEFGTKIKIYSVDDFWKMANRRRQWLFFFQHKNPDYLASMKRLLTHPMPKTIKDLFWLPSDNKKIL